MLYDTVHINERAGKVDLGPDVSICIDEATQIDGKENFKWQWSDGSTKQILETKELGTYWVSVSDNIGCQASDTIVVGRLTYNFDHRYWNRIKVRERRHSQRTEYQSGMVGF